jgi:hypothetical protein
MGATFARNFEELSQDVSKTIYKKIEGEVTV